MLVLIVSLTFLLAQLFVREKHTSHILFAVFCGSVTMLLTKNISGNSIGAYQHLIGLGAIAICNGYWLLSRSLFRDKDAIAGRHLALALAIALLVFIKQSYLFASSTALIPVSSGSLVSHTLSELTKLLSSCILVLSFWEGCRGYKNASKQEKGQRILFLATFGLAVAINKISLSMLAADPSAREWVISSLILLVLVNTQILMFWRYHKPKQAVENHSTIQKTSNLYQDVAEKLGDAVSCAEQKIAENVKTLLIEKQLFLKANLKVGDIAKALNLPEYRVSKALRNHLHAKNFNQYVNELRIGYAKEILVDINKQKWSVLVVGLESGFASVGPFTRAFKAATGFTPNQYRLSHLENSALSMG
ncbi:MAG: helix-turn-helix transcriptional regulator [Kangiellaceae bacterium]|nr:helix-turn-helix transcriptional regulator [Kangiellaceae bacterium]